MLKTILMLVLFVVVSVGGVEPVQAADLALSDVTIAACDASDPASQPEMKRKLGASCYVLSGEALNPGKKTIVDIDVFAQILDASGEPVLHNRTRLGSIGDVEPGSHHFALRLSVPSGTPGPFEVKGAKARGFSAPVRLRAGDDDELLPLEENVLILES
ncbi:MAG: hypothetical protein AB8E74_02440 [Prochlorococcus sp.]|nr:hypothetical protein [Prochlorococcaceae cyanobacterium Fu_MAG_50]